MKNAEEAIYREPHDFCTWDLLRLFGSLPLFGASYFAIIAICVWVQCVGLVNEYGAKIKASNVAEHVAWLQDVPRLPIPNQLAWTLSSLSLLAAAATLYRLGCPTQIQESTESRWVWELGQPVAMYRSLAASRLYLRWATLAAYVVGAPLVIWQLIQRVAGSLALIYGQ